MRNIHRLFFSFILGSLPFTPLQAKETSTFFWDASKEIAIAKSAAPENISANATVWVLTKAGYKKAIEGSNGFNCLVMRKWSAIFDVQKDLFEWDDLVAPVCFDPVSSKGQMIEQFRRHKLGLAGKSHDEIKTAIYTEYAEGKIPTPDAVSFSFMYSAAQKLSPQIMHGHPHVMVYAPNYTNDMLGGATPMSGDPIVFEAPGTFRATVAIPVNGRSQHIEPVISE